MRILIKIDPNLGEGIGPLLKLTSDRGEVIPETVTIQELLNGVEVVVTDYYATKIRVKPSGICNRSIFINIDKQNPYNIPNIVGFNSTYVGFGGSTGSLTNEHWLHDFNWTSGYDTIDFTYLKNNSNLLNNATIVGNSIRFTTAGGNQSGNVFTKEPIKILDSQGNIIDWSCYYVFSMGGGSGADGFSFILQSTSNTAGGTGGGLAYNGILNSVGIGYDIFYNWEHDPGGNHIELNVNGNVSNSLITYQPPFGMTGSTGTNKYVYNWVDYSGGNMKIYCSLTNSKPAISFIDYNINIKNYLIN